MVCMLESAGFVVEKTQLEYRPSELTTEREGRFQGWVKLMGAQFFEVLPAQKRKVAVKEVCDNLETVISHEEDSSRRLLGYVQLRVLTGKP